MPCIYALRNKVTDFAYIGCTKGKINKRMREHRCLLNSGKHLSTKLQEDWGKGAESDFEIIKLEELSENATVVDKRERELYWMQVYKEKLYNLYQVSFQPIPSAIKKGIEASKSVKGNRWTELTNEKRRIAQLGKSHSYGSKISETKKRLGQKPSQEAARRGGLAACSKRYGKTYV